MEIETLTILKDISWAGVIGLIVWWLFRPALSYFLNKQNSNGLNKRVDTIFIFPIYNL
jgi:hypothetical protein